MHFTDLIARLESGLTGPLPGAAAHAIVEPRPRRASAAADAPPLRDAAGLALVCPIEGRAHLVLTVRHGGLGRHAGQVSFPGGVVDAGETLEAAALREAHEEIALPPDAARILGRLTPVDIAVSGFRLHPIVAATATRPALAPADAEVERILEVGFDELTDPARLRLTERRRGGLVVEAPAFLVAGTELWGATAMAVAELLAVAGWKGRRP